MPDEPTGGSEHTVSRGDVSVHRKIESDGTGVVATVELRSAADEPMLVEVAEELPDDFPVESTGFKPEAMPDGKTVSDGRLRFEQAVVDEPVEVVYGLMLSEPVEELDFDAPSIESIEPVAAGASADDAGAGDAAEAVAEESTDGADGASDEPPALSLSLSDPDGSEAGASDDAGSTEPETASQPNEPESVAADGSERQPRSGGADERDRRSVDIRLDRLSARVEEFAAYAESLGTLVDEHGTPPEFVDRFDERIDDVDDRVATVRAELSEEVETVREDVTEAGGTIEDVEEDVRDVEDEVASVGDETAELRDDIDSLDDELAALREELDEVATSMERVREETATVREELRELQAIRGSLSDALAGWASSPGGDAEPGVDSDGDSDGASVVSDGGMDSEGDSAGEYTPAVTPFDPDD